MKVRRKLRVGLGAPALLPAGGIPGSGQRAGPKQLSIAGRQLVLRMNLSESVPGDTAGQSKGEEQPPEEDRFRLGVRGV